MHHETWANCVRMAVLSYNNYPDWFLQVRDRFQFEVRNHNSGTATIMQDNNEESDGEDDSSYEDDSLVGGSVSDSDSGSDAE